MLTKTQEKYTNSLKQKKYREESGSFVVEGEKAVEEFLYSAFEIEMIIALPEWLSKHRGIEKRFENKVIEATPINMERISSFSTPSIVLAVVKIPLQPGNYKPDTFILMLDGIRDPGNLGTIIRNADWFGIQHIICSPDCADAYNPKTVQASMGSLARITVYENDLVQVLEKNSMPVYGAVMKGPSLYEIQNPVPGIILIGNEGNGIRPALLPFISNPIFVVGKGKAESLNASVACGIICSWLCK